MTESKNKSNEWITMGLMAIIIGTLPVILISVWLMITDMGWFSIVFPSLINGIFMFIGVIFIMIGLGLKEKSQLPNAPLKPKIHQGVLK